MVRWLLVMALAAVWPATVPAQVVHYDPSAGFSATSNPNGVWRYGWMQTLGSAFNLDTSFHNSSGLDFWVGPVAGGSNEFFPYVAHNGTSATIQGGYTYDPGQLGMHPGPGGQYSVIRWTAPASATVRVSGSYYELNPGTTSDVHVLVNGVSALDGLVQSAGEVPFSFARTVLAGDRIEFAVGYGSDLDYAGDSTGLSASIIAQTVPEPASLALVGMAVSVMTASRMRRWVKRDQQAAATK
jgi:hypothetical protein